MVTRRNKLEFRITAKDDASHQLQKVSKETDALTTSLKGLASTAALIGLGVEALKLADTYRLLQNRLRLVTESQRELNVVTEELTSISLRSRTSFQSTADLYARVARSSRELGLSQQELLDFTEVVSKSIRISGSTAQEAAAGVIQFGQALASSRLSGDELRSVLEQMPRLAQAIAEGMGVGIGRLREMGEAGELTATRVLDSLRQAAPEIRAEFSQLIPLVSEAMTNVNSAVQVTIGRLDSMLGISVSLSEALLHIADNVIVLGRALDGTIRPGDELSDTFKRIAIFALVTAETLKTLGGGLKSGGERMAETAGELLAATAAMISTFNEGMSGQGPIINEQLGERLGEIWSPEELAKEQQDIVMSVTDMMEKIGKIMNDFAREERDPFDLTISGDALDDIGRKAREAMARSEKQLVKLRESLIQQQQAMFMAADEGIEYARALDIIKARALAAAAGNEAMGNEVIALMNALETGRNAVDDKKAVNALEEELRLIYLTNEQRFVALELKKLSADASDQQIQAVTAAATDLFRKQEELKNTLDFTEKLAERAAQNIQDAFAEFLFDPFEKGVKGMLAEFVKAIGMMMAQAASFQILSSIPGLGTFFSARAEGGPITAGQPVLVGERGPEVIIPQGNATVMNSSATKALGASGGPTFITNIDAKGADPGLISRLPSIMDERDRRLLAAVQRYNETGVMPI